MDRRSFGLVPTSPRPTMRALLFTVSLLASVPSVEALSSLPSISSSTGIAMAVVSVAAALSLVAGLAFLLGWIKKRLGIKKKKPTTNENVESGQSSETDSEEPEVFSLPRGNKFYEFLRKWKDQPIELREMFIVEIVKEFPVAVTPEMMMAVLEKMLSEEDNADLWMDMLRFIMMLERDLFRWNQTRQHQEGENTPTRRIHDQFQSFLVARAEDILYKYGDVAKPNETAKAGFMRFIAYLFGFVCKYKRILDLMDYMWTEHGLGITDASRAMVWGYRRWKDDMRFKCRPTATESNGKHQFFYVLMEILKDVGPGPRQSVGNTAQHLLFALGCGYEPNWREGPLEYMSDRKLQFCPMDYLWLMLGRDLVMGNAWHWICKTGLSEHNRMCNVFGQKSALYLMIVDMVMKYDEEYDEENRVNECIEKRALRYAPSSREALVKLKIDFTEHRNWYERYKGEKQAIGLGINKWLMENAEQLEGSKKEAGTGISSIRVAGAAASRSKSKSKSGKKKWEMKSEPIPEE